MDPNSQPRCKCQYSGVAPGHSASIIKNGSRIHTYNGANRCNMMPGDVLQNGVVRGRVAVPDNNQASWLNLN